MLKHFVARDVQHLLRTCSGTIIAPHDTKTELLIDRQWCEEIFNHCLAEPTVALACAHLLDATRHVPRLSLESRYVSYNQCLWESVTTSVALDPRFDVYIHNAAYYSGLAEVKSPLIRFFGKCIPVRCQNRVFWSIIRRALVRVWFTKVKRVKQPRFDDSVLQALKSIVLMALLGNYPHCTPGTRPKMSRRIRLYEVFTQKRFERWVVRLFHHCVTVVVMCVRTLMVVSYDHNAALFAVLDKNSGNRGLFDVKQFKSIVEAGMVQIRQRFNDDLCTPGTPLYNSFGNLPERPAQPSLYWVCDQKGCKSMPCPHVVRSYGKLKKSVRLQVSRRKAAKKRRLNGEIDHTLDDEDEEISDDQEEQIISDDITNDRNANWGWGVLPAHEQLNEVALEVEKRVGKYTSYERSHTDFAPLIVPLQKRHPLVPLDSCDEDGVAKRECDSVQAGGDNDPVSGQYFNAVHEPQLKQEKPQEHLQPHSASRSNESLGPGVPRLDASYERVGFLPYLRRPQIRALVNIVEVCGPVGYGRNALPRVVQFFLCYGIPEEIVMSIQRWFSDYSHDTQCVEKLKEKMAQLRLDCPHAYNLLHLSIKLLKECEKRMKLWELPHHIAVAQAEVLMDRYGRIHEDEFGVAFVFCDVCLHVYSNLRDPNSPYKNNYRYGLREAPIDCLTGKVYCQRGRVNHRGRCGENEMARIPMIGRALHFQYRTILICAQIGCGVLMVLDSKAKTYCLVNERGPACMTCSKKLDLRVQRTQELEELYQSKRAKVHCALCPSQNSVITNPYRRCHIYPFDIHLCSDHDTDEIRARVIAYLQSHPSNTLRQKQENEAAVKALILSFKDAALVQAEADSAAMDLIASLVNAL